MSLFETAAQKEQREMREAIGSLTELGLELRELRAENKRLRDEVEWLRSMLSPKQDAELCLCVEDLGPAMSCPQHGNAALAASREGK